MTGIAWGDYAEYFGTGETFKRDEVQTRKDGSLCVRGGRREDGYYVPTLSYVSFIKERVRQGLKAGIHTLVLEEPEYWADAGWSTAFQKAWMEHWDTPWKAPDSNEAAQFKASELKQAMYTKALADVFRAATEETMREGKHLCCYVATHSVVNYAHWRIVCPGTQIMHIPEVEGVIAQTWSDTARTPFWYRGTLRSRTFAAAYLEYAQMHALVRPHGKALCFLADPVQDNPAFDWNTYRSNYEECVLASLFFPDVAQFEIMPWSHRVFTGKYRASSDFSAETKTTIPPEYAAELLTVGQALGNMEQADVQWRAGTAGIALALSDTLMFQRAAPFPSDSHLSHVYALATPFILNGVPLRVVQLENIEIPSVLDSVRVLLLSYEGQKPMRREYHERLADWVKDGGVLVYVGDDSDPYHHIPGFWNGSGTTSATPREDLFRLLGADIEREGLQHIGKGIVFFMRVHPSQLAKQKEGDKILLEKVDALLRTRYRERLKTQGFLDLRRGPYRILAGLPESRSETTHKIKGTFVNLFDCALPILSAVQVKAGQYVLLYDVAWAREHTKRDFFLIAAAGGVRDVQYQAQSLRFSFHSVEGLRAPLRFYSETRPFSIRVEPTTSFDSDWDPETKTLLLHVLVSAPSHSLDIEFTS